MTKIAIVGAGSHVFARRLIADILTWPSLQDSTIALMDTHQGLWTGWLPWRRRMVEQQEHTGARVEPSTDLKQALSTVPTMYSLPSALARGATLWISR